MFTGKKHSEEAKRKISESRKKYKGKNHPRFGASWDDEQRAKFILTCHQRKQEEKQVQMFLIKHNELYEKFLLETNKRKK
jgi:hypothetical protein